MQINENLGQSLSFNMTRVKNTHFGTMKYVSPDVMEERYHIKKKALAAGSVVNIGDMGSWSLRRIVIQNSKPYWVLEKPNFYIRNKILNLIDDYLKGLKNIHDDLDVSFVKLATEKALGRSVSRIYFYTLTTYQIYAIYEVLSLYMLTPQFLKNQIKQRVGEEV